MSILDVENPKHLSDKHVKQAAEVAVSKAARTVYLAARDSFLTGETQHSVLQRDFEHTPTGLGGFEFMDRIGLAVKARLERFYGSVGESAVTYEVDFVEDEDRPDHGQWGLTVAAGCSHLQAQRVED